jgi:hypothetical protein
MIGKKIGNPKKSASKRTRIYSLVEYILNPGDTENGEKCVHAGALGFLSNDAEGIKLEMLALSTEAVRSRDTVNHYVLSWQTGEQPSVNQVRDAVAVLVKELGLVGHQAIWGLHADTANYHVHVVVNRVEPVTRRVIKPNKGFDIECLHKAISKIEYQQGWRPERNSRYTFKGNELVLNNERKLRPKQSKCDMEHRTGEKSAERIAIEEVAPLILNSQSWEAIHASLAQIGARYLKIGSGAVLDIGRVRVKASSASRHASIKKLEARLGPYQDANVPVEVVERKPEAVESDAPLWSIYIERRNFFYKSRARNLGEQKTRQKRELKAAIEGGRQRAIKHKRRMLNMDRRRTESKADVSPQALRAQHIKERILMRAYFSPFPSYRDWLKEQGHEAHAEQWRKRLSTKRHVAQNDQASQTSAGKEVEPNATW